MYQTVPVTCPNCNNRFASPVLTIIDVGQYPEAKSLFLAGQINIAVCPQCGHAGRLSSPLVYHDPEKDLLFTHIPAELGLPEIEQQRMIGDLTNRIISDLPAEQRKGYLLRPQTFLRLEGMIEAILEADGITPEMLKAQRAKAALLDRLMRTTSEEARRVIAQENDDQIDFEFFQILTLNLELAQTNRQEEMVRQLLALRNQLLEWTTVGHEVAAREEAIAELGTEITRENLLQKLVEAALAGQETKVETMVAIARPAIDYLFYQQLTGQIEAAERAGDTRKARTLGALRETVLNLTAEIDAEVRRATLRADQLLHRILASDDIEEAIRANLDQTDDLFLNALALNLQAAEQAGRSEEAEQLRKIGDILIKLIQESQPSELQLINALLTAEYPEGTQAVLEENRQQVNAQLLEIMKLVQDDLSQSGQEDAAQHLAQIRQQAVALVE